MGKKISLRSAAVIAGVTAIVTFSATSFWAFQICNDSVAHLRENAKSIEEIYTVDRYIDEKYYGEYDSQAILDSTLKGMISGLEDPYSAYMTVSEYEQSIINSKGSVSGIGVTVNLTENNEIKVVEVKKDGPAEKAGIKASDILVAVDGQRVSEIEYQEAVNLVRGEPGTSVSLTINRGGNELEFSMKREDIVTQTVDSKMLRDDIAYIRIMGFKETTETQYHEALQKLLDDGAKAIVFDVRNNSGGLVSACNGCLDPLLPEGEIAIAEFKDGTTETICESDANELNLPMIVLVNENSASAAELFAASLKDFGKAQLVGKNTFGKGIMQNTYNLDSGSGLRLTVAKYRTTKSECYHGIGLAPDFDVTLPEEYSETDIADIPENDDTQLQKAIEILEERRQQ